MLAMIQKSFFEALTRGQSPEGLKNGHRFNVYLKAYELRLLDSLEEDFPETLQHFSGREVLIEYIKSYYSNFWTLAEYSAAFPEFIRSKFQDNPLLYDVARIEWAKCLAQNIGYQSALEGSVPTKEDFILLINPSLQLLNLQNKNLAVYSWDNNIYEKEIDARLKDIITKSREGIPFNTISDSLQLEINMVLEVVEEWSCYGLIIGMK